MQRREGRSLQRWAEDPGWRGKIGFIATPVLDRSHIELLRIAPEGLAPFQTIPHVPNFRVNAEYISKAIDKLEECALALSDGGVDIIAQSGTPFSFAKEGGLAYTQKLHAKLERVTGKPVVMMGLAVINALKNKGYKSVAVACTYYNDDLATRYARFLEDAGIKVLAMENWVSQGFFKSQDTIEETQFWYPMSYTYKAARMVSSHAPEADCVVISGGAVRTMDVLEPLEYDLRKPVISSDAAFFWDILTRLDIGEPILGRGSLLASLDKGR